VKDRRSVLRLLGMIFSSAGALLLMGASAVLWNAYLEYSTLVTGFTRVNLFLFGVLPMALMAFRFLRGDRAHTEGLVFLLLLLLFVNQTVLAVQNGVSFRVSSYNVWKFVRSVVIDLGIAVLFADLLLKEKAKKHIPGLISAALQSIVWITWIVSVMSSAIPASAYSPALLKFGLLESLQMFARVLFLISFGCYLLWREKPE